MLGRTLAATAAVLPLFSGSHVHPDILGGTLSDDSQDAVVMIVHIDPSSPKPCDPLKQQCTEVCTGTMVAPKLVMTARHCVAKTNGNVACDSNGTPLIGGQVLGNFDAPDFYVFTGKNRPDFIGDQGAVLDTTKWHPQGQGAQILDDHSGTLCEHDLAMLLLKDPIPNVPLATMRLDFDPAVGEPLLTVGWGVASDEVEPKVRRQRSGDVSVERLGPDSSVPELTKTEFLFGESICLGDSGGPIFSNNSKALLGVVSRGGNGNDATGQPPAFTCTQAQNIGTKLSSFKQFILDGISQAGATPLVEPPPEKKSGCAVSSSPTPAPWSSPWLLAPACGLLLLARRRRSR